MRGGTKWAGVVCVLMIGTSADGNLVFDEGLFGTNGNGVNGNINDTAPLTGWGSYSRYASDGSTLTMDASSSVTPTGINDLGWTMSYINTEGYSTSTLLTVTFTAPTATNYLFSGTLDTSASNPVYTYSDVFLWDMTTNTGPFTDNAQWANAAVVSHVRAPDTGSFSGVLTAGHQYLFEMYLQTGVSTPGTTAFFGAAFDLDLSKVPAPGVVPAFGVAALLVARRRRR